MTQLNREELIDMLVKNAIDSHVSLAGREDFVRELMEAVLKAIGECLPEPPENYYTIDGEVYYDIDGKKYHMLDDEEVYDYEYLYTQFKNVCEGK